MSETYYLFAGESYYPAGGWDDYQDRYACYPSRSRLGKVPASQPATCSSNVPAVEAASSTGELYAPT